MLRRSLKNRIIATVAILVLLLIALYTAFWINRIAERMEQDFERQVAMAVQLSTSPLAAALWEFDATRAESALEGLHELPAYRFGEIRSADQIFARSPSAAWRPAWTELLAAAGEGRMERGAEVAIAVPLTRDGVRLGVLRLGFSRQQHLDQKTALMVETALYALLFALAMALVLSAWLSKALGPLSPLAAAVRRCSEGAPPEQGFYTGRTDEIGDLAQAVDLLRRSHIEARTDQLTGLPNRRALEDALALLGESDAPYAVLIIDLDDFKPINDAFGHQTGDAVLREVAARFAALAAAERRFFRVGGDEFAALARGAAAADDAARRLGLLIAETLRAPIHLGEEALQIGASIGVARSRDVDGPPIEVHGAADAAMYAAKRAAAPRVVQHTAGGGRRRSEQRQARELAAALDSGAIAPWLQPQICLASGRLVGFEALARWRHPDRGLLAPIDFMPQVEALQMQRTFDLSILRQTLQMVRAAAAAGAPQRRVAVNLAEQTLVRRESVDEILWLLEEHAICRDWITLEITEDVFTARSAEAIQRSLARLFEIGVRLSMDDFGTGYGSFRHLQEWDFHELKIDRAFVAHIGADRSSEVIIRGFLAIADGLGAEVVAEGVETEAQAAFLRKQGCQYAQGWLFGRPVPAAQAEALLLGDDRDAAGAATS